MPKGHAIYHYASKNDYAKIIEDVGVQLKLKYAVDEWRLKPDYLVYDSPLEAPDFGYSAAPQYAGTKSYFVLPEDAELPFSYRPQRQVPEKYGFDLALLGEPPNYRWVQFRPSGTHKSAQWGDGMNEGWTATNSGHPDSLDIFNAFKKSIKKRFQYVRQFGVYIGPEAMKYLESGGRLNQDLRSPRESDVKLTQPATNTTP